MKDNPCPPPESFFGESAERKAALEHAQSCPACAALLEEHRQLEKDLSRLADPLPPPDFVQLVMAKVARAPAPARAELKVGLLVLGLALALGVLSFLVGGGDAASAGVAVARALVRAREVAVALASGLEALSRGAGWPLAVGLAGALLAALSVFRRLVGVRLSEGGKIAALLLPLALPYLAHAAEPVPARNVTVEFRGKLKDGLREIAAKGGMNLIVTGELDQPAEIYLKDASAEEALSTVAAAYQLKVLRQGSIWTMRPLTEKERESAPKEEVAAPPPLPALPPLPPSPFSAEEKEDFGEKQDRLKKKMEKLKTKLGRKGTGERVGTGSVVVEEGAVVESAVAFGGDLTVRGGAVVEDDAVAFGGDVVLERGSVVEGDAVAFGGQVRQEEGAVVEGDAVSMGIGGSLARKLHRGDSAKKDEEQASPRKEIRSTPRLPGFFLRFALLFGLGFLFLMFMPARMKEIEGELRRDPIKCGVTGFFGSLLLVVLTVLLAVTIVGIPFAIVLWLLVGLGIAMGFSVIASEIGLKLPVFRKSKTQALVLALGLLVLLGAAEIPVLGPISMTLLGLAALGAIIRTRFGQTPKGIPRPDAPGA